MCGIVGLLVKNPALRDQLGELMVPMLIGMTERGPDSAGLAVFTEPLPERRAKVQPVSGLTEEGPISTGRGSQMSLQSHLGVEVTIEAKGNHAILIVGTRRGRSSAGSRNTIRSSIYFPPGAASICTRTPAPRPRSRAATTSAR